jgi:tRNA (adenine22-N1)-methyltransferase
MVKLSQRLQTIADQVPSGSRLADIGSDHALLPTYLAQQNKITFGIAGEINAGPYEAALKQIRDAHVGHIVQARKGDGLEVIEQGEVNVITIAGMGGSLIASILEAGRMKLKGIDKMVLQPNVGEDHLREWLFINHWVLISEQILKEDGKIYEILTAIPEEQAPISNEELYQPKQLAGMLISKRRLFKMGPYLLDSPNEVWFEKWWLELEKLDMILRQLGQSEQPASRIREQEIRDEMREIKEVLTCLRKDKPLYN